MRLALVILALIAAAIGAVLAFAAASWNGATAETVRQLQRASGAPAFTADLAHELEGLPLPVQRYLRTVLGEHPPIVRAATIQQAGDFLVKPEPNGWRPFTATHYAVTQPPGFVWDARIRMVPGVAVRVRDVLFAGPGSMHASIAGLRRVAYAANTPDMASGALHRYLAEAVWFPTALLPSAGVRWTAVDDFTARAALSVGTTTVSLDFHFGKDGLVERVYTPTRARAVDGRSEPTPWQGHFSQYEERGGLRVPTAGAVEWVLPEGPQPYWRGRLTKVQFTTVAGER